MGKGSGDKERKKEAGKDGKEGKEKDSKGLTVKKGEDFSEWYTQIVQKAELADYTSIQGFMVIRPNAYELWESIQSYFNKVLEKKRVKNAYFPLLIPEKFFKKEAEHAKGFAPELAYVMSSENGERLALRPTSETIIYDSYAKWIRSWRDLPLQLNQWCNVIRWEVKQTKPFLRTREFLWQEGHCAFESEEEAEQNMVEIAEEYRKMIEELLAIPVIVGKKSEMEKFPGAKITMTIEALMPDGKALQLGTSHNLGQGFAKVFDVAFKGRDGGEQYVWQTSWGFSTRLIGALAMVHGDDKGLVLPPRIANQKAVIVPIVFEDSKENVMKKAEELEKKLKKYGVFLDNREYSPGWKFSEWELKGIPLRIELGPRDIERKQVVVVRRDTGKKEIVKEKEIEQYTEKILEKMQKELFIKAKKFLDSRISRAETLSELREKVRKGDIVKAYFENKKEVEEMIKAETGGATSRIIEEEKEGKCVITGKKTKTIGYFAKAY